MNSSKAQIDARLALRSLASPRSRKAVYAPGEALYYRYEGRQFFYLDFPTFASLFAALTRQQLSTVAKAPDVIEASSQTRSTLDDSWSRLYREGRKSKPVLAALSLVGISEAHFHVEGVDLTRQEAGHHALTEALGAQEAPPVEIIDTCSNHLRWLKDTLCGPDPGILQPARSVTQSSHGAHGSRADSRKRSLSDTGSPGDTQCRKKHVGSVQIDHDDAGREALGIAFTRHVGDNGNSAMLGVDQTLDNVVSHPASSLGSAPTLEVGKLTTSRTVEPSIDLGSFPPFESGFDGWITDNVADGWITNSIPQPAPQPRETHNPDSSTMANPQSAPADDTNMKHLPCTSRRDSMRLVDMQEIDCYAVWDNNNNVLGDVDKRSFFQ